ncbi:ClpXP adapter SpxH family protein [Pullulanibacillus sp. KACC 23026]|uniref:ClpXP adapter SpxH family protein n=1 Tax=Pullulanibacillus sp. KACC 23026 TaxID=3028315 RepID=UPI0023B19F10|nr:ClpXP adapter SpxH family protein [Pullulanibacillus sp. KACC 23026]WEG11914.1 ClpXP adapter SpxH family protein [Pullulanibacillus sp. KACC 23026]
MYRSTCDGSKGNEMCSLSMDVKKIKPIEIYSFLDPICPECWGLEPITKKLAIEYGEYLSIRTLLGINLNESNKSLDKKLQSIQWGKTANLTGMSCDDQVLRDSPPSPWKAIIAVKAAELQGRLAGQRFLRILQEKLFLAKQDINDEEILLACAKAAQLDLNEFQKDLDSNGPIKAFQCDRKIISEMEVIDIPTLVFFNVKSDEEGIKISGRYPYSVYVQILTEMLGNPPSPKSPPDMVSFLKDYHFIATKELAVVYDLEEAEAERELKKLQLKQIVEAVPVKYGTFWRYIGD